MRRRSGFSLVEVSVACVLTAFLAVMLSTTWRLLMPSTTDLIVWGQLFQEMQIAVAAIGRDAGGALPEDCSRTIGTAKQQGLLLACQKNNDGDGDHLQLCFDGVYPYGVGSQGYAADGHGQMGQLGHRHRLPGDRQLPHAAAIEPDRRQLGDRGQQRRRHDASTTAIPTTSRSRSLSPTIFPSGRQAADSWKPL